jgi:hypothetical protein
MKQKLYVRGMDGCRVQMDNMNMQQKPRKKILEPAAARPTISLRDVTVVTGGDGSFSGWGPKVSNGNLLKNWN